MAATVSKAMDFRADPWFIHEVEMSALVADQTENVANGSPTSATGVGMVADMVTWEVITPPTALCSFSMFRLRSSDSTSNNTSALKFVAAPGGDLTGAVVKVRFHYFASKAGGISAT